MSQPMMWVFAVLIVLAMGGVAMLAAGYGEPMAEAYDDRPDAVVPSDRPVAGEDLRKVRFSLALRGYRMSEVDALLTRLAGELEAARGAGPPVQLPGDGATPVDSRALRARVGAWLAAEPDGDMLDYSADSVDVVESLLDQWARAVDRAPAADNEQVWAAGAYVGETLLREAPGAAWVRHDGFGGTPVVAMPSGRLEDPIGRAAQRYEGDERDSIVAFLQAAVTGGTRSSDA